MKTDDFNFDLPEELVAQDPPERRGESRLLVLDRASGSLSHSMVRDLPGWIEPGSLMVFNDSRVRKARLYGQALDTGARVEFLLLRRRAPDEWEAAATKLKRQRPGRRYAFPEGVEAEVLPDPVGAGADTRRLRFEPPIDEAYLERVGHVPLPPYIKRDDRPADEERYQTVYSRAVGSAACPTAGLHFTEELLAALDGRGVERATLTLHVGMGTFLPVRSENVEDHAMHEEEYTVSEAAAAAVMRAKAEGRPVIAVGTTSLRTLESAWG
ncbi:MAG TPA: tRNA preQ1(34) S-adenosylmethionine ribosyltransferase-isomerase QueA, partial [Spirochaetales bacterium]|nr:tRNA preQ1(34) S-adenosylmethionine ribosyltransferase-isomerase QueA [Spirochaetales bacterium]